MTRHGKMVAAENKVKWEDLWGLRERSTSRRAHERTSILVYITVYVIY